MVPGLARDCGDTRHDDTRRRARAGGVASELRPQHGACVRERVALIRASTKEQLRGRAQPFLLGRLRSRLVVQASRCKHGRCLRRDGDDA